MGRLLFSYSLIFMNGTNVGTLKEKAIEIYQIQQNLVPLCGIRTLLAVRGRIKKEKLCAFATLRLITFSIFRYPYYLCSLSLLPTFLHPFT